MMKTANTLRFFSGLGWRACHTNRTTFKLHQFQISVLIPLKFPAKKNKLMNAFLVEDSTIARRKVTESFKDEGFWKAV